MAQRPRCGRVTPLDLHAEFLIAVTQVAEEERCSIPDRARSTPIADARFPRIAQHTSKISPRRKGNDVRLQFPIRAPGHLHVPKRVSSHEPCLLQGGSQGIKARSPSASSFHTQSVMQPAGPSASAIPEPCMPSIASAPGRHVCPAAAAQAPGRPCETPIFRQTGGAHERTLA